MDLKGKIDDKQSAAAMIEQLVEEYVADHSDYQYPRSGDRHPAILALGTSIHSWLIERIGGPSQFLNTILDAAEIWFPPGCESRELRIFRALFEGSANVSWGNMPEYRPITERYLAWLRTMRGRYTSERT